MKRIDIDKRAKIDLREFITRSAFESDYSTLITEDTALYEGGKLTLLYITPKESFAKLRKACDSIKFNLNNRQAGMSTTSRVFGFEPRKPMRVKDYCSVTALAHESPKVHSVLMESGEVAAKYYSEHNPDLFRYHTDLSKEKLEDDYQIDGMPFTSGIVNKNNPLKYHFDTGNYRSVWQALIALKDGIKGGHLAMPEFDLALELKDGTVSFFDGQGILHGVTPIRRMRPDATRYTVVYYSLLQMWTCEPVTDEVLRAREARSQREKFGRKEENIAKERARLKKRSS